MIKNSQVVEVARMIVPYKIYRLAGAGAGADRVTTWSRRLHHFGSVPGLRYVKRGNALGESLVMCFLGKNYLPRGQRRWHPRVSFTFLGGFVEDLVHNHHG